jgi:hypothetical protein
VLNSAREGGRAVCRDRLGRSVRVRVAAVSAVERGVIEQRTDVGHIVLGREGLVGCDALRIVSIPVVAGPRRVDLDDPRRRGRAGELRFGDEHVAMTTDVGNQASCKHRQDGKRGAETCENRVSGFLSIEEGVGWAASWRMKEVCESVR